MVTTAGFNALLKVVEEPPPHVKFVFATTEPDKVISTIRSRTHHYPFRLVPPRLLTEYLAKLCDAEGIPVEAAVLPLVVRAGGGSVRDSLSVLDQLLGGADEAGVSYRQAAALLGYTPDSLLDEFVDAFAAGDAGGVFACVDKVIEVGQDPRRFAEDLLRRLRDLVIVAAVPDALTSGLVDVAPDQADRLSSQAASLGAGELTRAAEVLATGLTEMRGTTAPRLHLELMCARVLLPGADVDDRGLHARLDRLERRVGVTEGAPVRAATSSPPTAVPDEPAPAPAAEPASPVHPEPVEEPPAQRAATSSPPTPPQLTVGDVRRLWPEVLEEVKGKRRFTWILLSQNAQVAEIRNGTLLLAMSNAGARDSFARGGSEDVLREAMVVVMGADFAVETMVDPSAAPASGAPRTPPAGEPSDATRSAPDASRGRAANGVGIAAAEDPDTVASRDDTDIAEDAESHTELLARHLGAEIIAEEDHGA
jgi:DNA polymerase-3 subunit gamma/tau